MKKIISLLLALASVVCLMSFITAEADDSDTVKQNISYTEVFGRINQNDCGFTISSKYVYSGPRSRNESPMNDSNFQFYNIGLRRWSDNAGGKLEELPEWYLNYLDKSLSNLRKNGGACIIRCSYALDGEINSEPSSFEMLQRHQEQLGGVFTKYPDIIVAVECGMAGAFGEMHSGLYSDPSYKLKILTKWLEVLDKDISVNVRKLDEYTAYLSSSDTWKNKYKNQTVNGITYPRIITPDNYYKFFFKGTDIGRIGLYNDAMIQDGNDGGTFSGGREAYNKFLNTQGRYTSYGGEFSGADTYRYMSNTWLPLRAIPEFYQNHMAYYHGGNAAYDTVAHFKSRYVASRDYNTAATAKSKVDEFNDWMKKYGSDMKYTVEAAGSVVNYDIGGWDSAIFGEDLLSAIKKLNPGITADIKDYLGKSVASLFEDHIGYRFVLRESNVSKSVAPGSVLRLNGAIDNVGFGNVAKYKRTEIVISDGKNTYTVATDLDVRSWDNLTRNSYNVQIKLPSSIPAGNYKVYMRIASVAPDGTTNEAGCVKFANAGAYKNNVPASAYSVKSSTINLIYDPNMKANEIGSFTVTDEDPDKLSDDSIKQVTVDFDDVSKKFWGRDSITTICTLGYMNGMGGGIFAPDSPTTRGQVVTVLYNMENKPDVTGISNPFKDVKNKKYYAAAIKWAYKNEIVMGTSATTFDPEANVTREQFATMLYRYAAFKGRDTSAGGDLSAFKDASSVSKWAKSAMLWANTNGYVTGMTSVTLAPGDKATRAQLATMLVRFLRS